MQPTQIDWDIIPHTMDPWIVGGVYVRCYRTNAILRLATYGEWRESCAAARHDGGAGVFLDSVLDISVYVEGNPQ
jgi:hypothetical protein